MDLTENTCEEASASTQKMPRPLKASDVTVNTDPKIARFGDAESPAFPCDLLFFCARCNNVIDENATLRKCGCVSFSSLLFEGRLTV